VGLLVLALLFPCTASRAQGIYLQSTSSVSARSAVLEDDGHVAYLYLCAPGTFTPEREAVVYSRRPPVPKVDWWELSKTGETAPISQDIAAPAATLPHPRAEQFTFRWSGDGEAVAVLHDGHPMAFVASSQPRGHSKAVRKRSALAMPWDQRLYDVLFGN
jgi:hypothetical protein